MATNNDPDIDRRIDEGREQTRSVGGLQYLE